MNTRRTVLGVMLVVAMLAGGCVQATVGVRQDDGTYKYTRELIPRSSFDDLDSFKCERDYDVASTMHGVQYAWPKGRGSLVDYEMIVFDGKGLHCEVKERSLTVNGQSFGEFDAGDRVRIAPDGRVYVNDVERPSQ